MPLEVTTETETAPSCSALTRSKFLSEVLYEESSKGGLGNQIDVLSRLVPKLPGAICHSLEDDWSNHQSALWGKLAISTAVGLGSAVLLSRSPALVKSVMGLMGVTAAMGGTVATGSFLHSAWNADTERDRELLAARTSHTLGGLAADMIETTPAFLAGTGGGVFLTSRLSALENLALRVRHVADFRVRPLMPEALHYVGADVKTVAGIGRSNGTLDLLAATEKIAKSNPWIGIEEGRLFKAAPGKIKFGSALPGTADDVVMGRRAEHMMHTHAEKLLPTSGDFNSVRGTGVISVPKYGITTFYEGTSAEAEKVLALRRAGRLQEAEQSMKALQERSFSSLVVDRTRSLALKVETRWNGITGLEPVSVKPVDFVQAVEHLRNWNGRTLRLAELASSQEALLKPGMTDLMQRVVQKR